MLQGYIDISDDFTLYAGKGFSHSKGKSPMGLSECPKLSQGTETPHDDTQSVKPARKRRGLKGLTRKNAVLVRSAVDVMNHVYGKRRLVMLTCTIPTLSSRAAHEALNRQWAEIVRKFIQELQRELVRDCLPESITAVTEIQDERLTRRKLLCPHLHIIFCNRHPHGKWVLSTEKVSEIWNRIIANHTNAVVNNKASTNIEAIRKNPKHYLTKYMSKGTSIKKAIEYGLEDQLPTTWHYVSPDLKQAVSNSREKLTSAVCDFIEKNLQKLKDLGYIRGYHRIEIDYTEPDTNFTRKVLVGVIGCFADGGYEKTMELFHRECALRRLNLPQMVCAT